MLATAGSTGSGARFSMPGESMETPKLFGNLFLSAGAMKAGTTWLFAVLERHPELFFSPEKELHYFYAKYVNAEVLSDQRRLDQAKQRYIERIEPARTNIERVRYNLHWLGNYLNRPVDDFWYRNMFIASGRATYNCDFSNFYALLPAEAWPQIAASCDRLRVIYTLRHPVKRLWSHVKFHLQITGKTDLLDNWSPRDFEKFARQRFIWENAEYGEALRRMTAGLRPDSLKVLFFEDMHARKQETLAEIETFLGIAPYTYPPAMLNKPVNPSIPRPMPDFFPDLFAEDVARITREVVAEGLQIPADWSA